MRTQQKRQLIGARFKTFPIKQDVFVSYQNWRVRKAGAAEIHGYLLWCQKECMDLLSTFQVFYVIRCLSWKWRQLHSPVLSILFRTGFGNEVSFFNQHLSHYCPPSDFLQISDYVSGKHPRLHTKLGKGPARLKRRILPDFIFDISSLQWAKQSMCETYIWKRRYQTFFLNTSPQRHNQTPLQPFTYHLNSIWAIYLFSILKANQIMDISSIHKSQETFKTFIAVVACSDTEWQLLLFGSVWRFIGNDIA